MSNAPKITYRCAVCNTPVRPGTGHVGISNADLRRHREALAIWRLEVEANQRTAGGLGVVISGAALLAFPDRAPWRVHHSACNPHPDDAGYEFDVGRASTHEQLLVWTAHLMEKNWVRAETDWAGFVRRHVSAEALRA